VRPVNRREFFSLNAGIGSGCALLPQAAQNDPHRAAGPPSAAELFPMGSNFRITNIKTFGVTLPTPEQADRPYVFVKIETNQGVYGWGEGRLEGKAAATIHCIEDFKEFLIGADPMPVEHHWQSRYIHSFYRAGPVIGSAIAAIDQAPWDIRGKILKQPVYKLLGGPYDPAGVPGYYHVRANTPAEMREVRAKARQLGVTAIKGGIPGYFEWIETHAAITRAVKHVVTLRVNLGEEIDTGIDFHAKTSPAVASILRREMEPYKLLFIEEPCPPENVKAMQRIALRTKVPIATGEGLVASYNCRELVELGIVDIIHRYHPSISSIDIIHRYHPDRYQPLRRHCQHPCRRRHAELPRAGDPLRRRIRRQGEDLGGVVRLPRHAPGQRQVSPAHQARPRLRSGRKAGGPVPVRRHPSHGPRLPPGRFRGGLVARRRK
jgi:L-alanine-DL-glutamate epimerase-like enolase superfamily enzyme